MSFYYKINVYYQQAYLLTYHKKYRRDTKDLIHFAFLSSSCKQKMGLQVFTDKGSGKVWVRISLNLSLKVRKQILIRLQNDQVDPSHNIGIFADKTQIFNTIIYDSSPWHFLAGQCQCLSQGFSWQYSFLADPLLILTLSYFMFVYPFNPLPQW